MPMIANALSCMPYNPLRDFNYKVEAEATYVIYLGTHEATQKVEDPNKDRSRLQQGIEFSVPVKFTARALNRNGLQEEESFTGQVSLSCAGPWCAGYGDVTKPTVLFLKKTPQGFVREIGPCDGFHAEADEEEVLTALKKCLRRGRCSEQQIQKFERWN